MAPKPIPFNNEEMTIMGVKFDNRKQYLNAKSTVASSWMEGWQPTKQEIEDLRTVAREVDENV